MHSRPRARAHSDVQTASATDGWRGHPFAPFAPFAPTKGAQVGASHSPGGEPGDDGGGLPSARRAPLRRRNAERSPGARGPAKRPPGEHAVSPLGSGETGQSRRRNSDAGRGRRLARSKRSDGALTSQAGGDRAEATDAGGGRRFAAISPLFRPFEDVLPPFRRHFDRSKTFYRLKLFEGRFSFDRFDRRVQPPPTSAQARAGAPARPRRPAGPESV